MATLSQGFCQENLIDRGAGQATVHGITKESDITQQLKNNILTPPKGDNSLKLLKKHKTAVFMTSIILTELIQ